MPAGIVDPSRATIPTVCTSKSLVGVVASASDSTSTLAAAALTTRSRSAAG